MSNDMDEKILASLIAKGLLDTRAVLTIRNLIAHGKTIEQAAIGGRYVHAQDFLQACEQLIGSTRSRMEDAEGSQNVRTTIAMPASRIVDVILRQANEGAASEVHIEPFENNSRVRYRKDGVLRTSLTIPLHVHAAIVSCIKLLARLTVHETRKPQQGTFSQDFQGKKINFRVMTIPVVDTEKLTLHLVQDEKHIKSLEQLGFRKEQVESVTRHADAPGIFIISGPLGSGKTETVHSLQRILAAKGVPMSSADSVTQLSMRDASHVYIADEIQEKEQGEMSMYAALTDHGLISTVRSKSMDGIFPRMVQKGFEPHLFSSALHCLIQQRLVRKICDQCKVVDRIDSALASALTREIERIPDAYPVPDIGPRESHVFYKGEGCSSCGGTGYAGRLLIAEVVECTDDVRSSFEQEFNQKKFDSARARQGSLSLREDALLKAVQGYTTVSEIQRVSPHIEQMEY